MIDNTKNQIKPVQTFIKRATNVFFPPAPTQIISYQKSGRTWLRLIVGRLFEDHFNLSFENSADILNTGDFHRLDPHIPPLVFSHDGHALYQKSSELESNKDKYKNLKIVLLCRDPRDVAISTWFRKEKNKAWLDNRESLDSIEKYIRDDVCGIEKIIHFLNIWADNRNVPKDFLLIRYEDMLVDTVAQIKKLLLFINVKEIPVETIDNAVEFCSFDNMKKMEKSDALGSPLLKPIDANKPESFKIRKGTAGGYKDDLSPADIDYVDDLVVTKLDKYFGYSR
jgi:hypothetical protein